MAGFRLLATLLTLLFGALTAAAMAAPLEGRDYAMSGDRERMRITLGFDGEPDPGFLLLRSPHRLVVDLPGTRLILDPDDVKPRGLIRGVRYGKLRAEDSRLILIADGPFEVERFEIVADGAADGDATGRQLVIDLASTTEKAFELALAEQAQTTGSTIVGGKSDRIGQPAARPGKRFTIVLDPGHGGIDPGAEGHSGTAEKTVTLTFAMELRDWLLADGRYDVYLTREEDEFLRLDERVRIARDHAADLFISIHADTIRQKAVRGATVYTISDKASDAEAQALADRENLADQLAGIVVEEENQQVADILIDLIRRETHSYSIRFARSLVGELAERIGLINNPHRFASFKVLKAPDVPSVLVELGYLSNAEDEKQLKSEDWRKKAVSGIANAIEAFASAKMGVGG